MKSRAPIWNSIAAFGGGSAFIITILIVGAVYLSLLLVGLRLIYDYWMPIAAATIGIVIYIVMYRKYEDRFPEKAWRRYRHVVMLANMRGRLAVALYAFMLIFGLVRSLHVTWVDRETYRGFSAWLFERYPDYEDMDPDDVDGELVSSNLRRYLEANSRSGWIWDASSDALLDERQVYRRIVEIFIVAIAAYMLAANLFGPGNKLVFFDWLSFRKGFDQWVERTAPIRYWWQRVTPGWLLLIGLVAHLMLAYPGGERTDIIQYIEQDDIEYEDYYRIANYRPIWVNYRYNFGDYGGLGHLVKLAIIHLALWYLLYLVKYRRQHQRLFLMSYTSRVELLQ